MSDFNIPKCLIDLAEGFRGADTNITIGNPHLSHFIDTFGGEHLIYGRRVNTKQLCDMVDNPQNYIELEEESEEVEESTTEKPDLESMTVADLKLHADMLGIQIPNNLKKSDLVAVLESYYEGET